MGFATEEASHHITPPTNEMPCITLRVDGLALTKIPHPRGRQMSSRRKVNCRLDHTCSSLSLLLFFKRRWRFKKHVKLQVSLVYVQACIGPDAYPRPVREALPRLCRVRLRRPSGFLERRFVSRWRRRFSSGRGGRRSTGAHDNVCHDLGRSLVLTRRSLLFCKAPGSRCVVKNSPVSRTFETRFPETFVT